MLKSFSSRFEPEAVAGKLRELVDEEIVDPASPTLYAGNLPYVGRASAKHFELRRRAPIHWVLWWMTPGRWFQPVVSGGVTKTETGSRIEIAAGTPVWIKIIWALKLVGALAFVGLFTLFNYPYSIAHDPGRSASDLVLGLAVLSVVAAILILLPLVGWLVTKEDVHAAMNELESRLELSPID